MVDFKINDVVKYLGDEKYGEVFLRNMIGVVVSSFQTPKVAFQVEFSDEQGRTITTIVALPDELEGVSLT